MDSSARSAGAALIFGWAAYMLLMAVHPTHLGGPSLGHVNLNDAVHWSALALIPVIGFGYIGLARALGFERAPVMIGLGFALFSLFAGLVAGTINGLALPEVLARLDTAEVDRASLEALRQGYWWLNQGFAAIHYTFGAVSCGLFGLAWLRDPARRGLAWAGIVIALGFLIWLATGLWHPDIHGALFITLALGGWAISAGFVLRRT